MIIKKEIFKLLLRNYAKPEKHWYHCITAIFCNYEMATYCYDGYEEH